MNPKGFYVTGNASVQGVVPDEQGNVNGTYEGLVVSEDIKKQIEQGDAKHFWGFTKTDDGYAVYPTLPEFGCVEGGQVFKIRENNNLLMKGLARKMIRDDGTLDIDKGQKFMEEFRLRFGVDSTGKDRNFNDPDNPMESNREVLKKSAHQWLMRELNIPSEKKEDFERFIDATVMDSDVTRRIGSNHPRAFRIDSFFTIMDNWIQNCRSYDRFMSEKEADPAFASNEVIRKNIEGRKNLEEEIKDIAFMNVESQKRAILPCACDASMNANKAFMLMADEADKVMGKPVPEGRENTSWREIISENDEYGKEVSAFNKRISQLNKKISEYNKNKEENDKDPLKKKEFEDNKKKLAEEKQNLDKYKNEMPNTLYNEHFAFPAGKFVDAENKVHYLTIEGFAPKTTEFGIHPAVSEKQLGIGVFNSQDAWKQYYDKLPRASKNPVEVELINKKSEYTLQNADDYTEVRDKSNKEIANNQKLFAKYTNSPEYREAINNVPEFIQKRRNNEQSEIKALGNIKLSGQKLQSTLDRTVLMYSNICEESEKLARIQSGYKNIGKQIMNDNSITNEEKHSLLGKLDKMQEDNQKKNWKLREQKHAMEQYFRNLCVSDPKIAGEMEAGLTQKEKDTLNEAKEGRYLAGNLLIRLKQLTDPAEMNISEKDRKTIRRLQLDPGTLGERLGLSKQDAILAYYKKLKADDKMLHMNSTRFNGLLRKMGHLEQLNNQYKSDQLTETQKENLRGQMAKTMNEIDTETKAWLTESNRKSKHLSNKFDNKRYNTMYALAFETDPTWAQERFRVTRFKQKIDDAKLLRGMDDLVNTVHKDILQAGHARGNVTEERWFNREIRTKNPAAHRVQNNAPVRERNQNSL